MGLGRSDGHAVPCCATLDMDASVAFQVLALCPIAPSFLSGLFDHFAVYCTAVHSSLMSAAWCASPLRQELSSSAHGASSSQLDAYQQLGRSAGFRLLFAAILRMKECMTPAQLCHNDTETA